MFGMRVKFATVLSMIDARKHELYQAIFPILD